MRTVRTIIICITLYLIADLFCQTWIITTALSHGATTKLIKPTKTK